MRFAILFGVEIVHDYFLNSGDVVHEALTEAQRVAAHEQYSVAAYLEVAPAPRTLSVLAGHRLMFKGTANGFVVAAELDAAAPDDRPALPPDADFRLTFALRARDPLFFNYTAVCAPAESIYRLGNDSGNETAGGRHLSASVEEYDTARAYQAGELYASSSSTVNLFRALRDTGPAGAPVAADWERIPADTHDPAVSYTRDAVVLAGNLLYRALVDGPGTNLDNAAEWHQFDVLANQYVSHGDLLELKSLVFNLDLGPANLGQATVQVFKPGRATPVHTESFSAASGDLGEVQLDLRRLAAGRYSLVVVDADLVPVPDFDLDLYIDSTAIRKGWFGVIEIGAGDGDLALLDETGALRSPRYSIRFLNRATRWRYIFPEAQPIGAGADVSPEDPAGRVLVTDSPHPLTRYGTGLRLRADDLQSPGASEDVRLPEPDVKRIRRENAQWFSEIHLSNYPSLV